MSLPNQNRRCYLHIGTNKTGSTYIQQAIHGYDDGATYVPRLGRANQSYFLIGAFEVENKRRGEARAARRQFAGAKVCGWKKLHLSIVSCIAHVRYYRNWKNFLHGFCWHSPRRICRGLL